ncbi:hypothetical protein KS18_21605 [Photorhabdus luminescens]|nr:hypothetical protein KS18_21605 [Photorhabdus luminescens]
MVMPLFTTRFLEEKLKFKIPELFICIHLQWRVYALPIKAVASRSEQALSKIIICDVASCARLTDGTNLPIAQ